MALIGALVVVAVIFVASSLRGPELEWYPVSAANPEEAGDTLIGPLVYTADGRGEEWAFFDFSSGSVVLDPHPLGWDLAFRRFTVMANGGDGFLGKGGVRDLGPVSFDSVVRVPATGYTPNRAGGDSATDATARWYDYSWTSHVLRPKPKVFAVRAADGRYAIVQILSYYCPGAQAGCLTVRYRYQGAGGTSFAR